MGPPAIWHYVDTIYSTSASLSRLSRTSPHLISARKAAFLAHLQAVLTRTCYQMLLRHTAAPAPPAGPPPPPPHAAADDDPDADPASSCPTTPDPDQAPDPSPATT